MNERIRELAIEATLIVAEPNGFDPTRLSMSQQKFAQLIVAECASRVTGRQPDHWGNMTDEIINECIIECATDLKRHFGVEE
jgi:hypothetical protein